MRPASRPGKRLLAPPWLVQLQWPDGAARRRPPLLIVAGAIGAAISILWTRSGDFHDALSGLLRYISTQGQRIFSAFGDAINTVRDAFSTTHETITQTADGLERSACSKSCS